jgi:hypothetical protein
VIPQYDLPEVANVDKRVFTNFDLNNFGPRVGFAYAPLASGRMSLRGGYGVFYSRASLFTSPTRLTLRRPTPFAEVRQVRWFFWRPFHPTPVARSIPCVCPRHPEQQHV